MSGAPDLAEAADNVVLVDAAGAVIGEAPRAAVHTTTKPQHRASRSNSSTTQASC
jgi:isopentenyldiphosphate isomerase